jgi:hypothetical protein
MKFYINTSYIYHKYLTIKNTYTAIDRAQEYMKKNWYSWKEIINNARKIAENFNIAHAMMIRTTRQNNR